MNTRVRAVIIKDNKVLLIKRTRDDLTYWVIPGGAVEAGESKNGALVRECQEELGISVRVKELLLKMPSKKPETKGQQEYFYFCEIVSGKLGSGQGPEYQKNSSYIGRHDIEWKSLSNLSKIDLKPKKLQNLLKNFEVKKLIENIVKHLKRRATIIVTIDRPIGVRQNKKWRFYPFNYGHVEIMNPVDGGEFDAIALNFPKLKIGQKVLTQIVGIVIRPDKDHKLITIKPNTKVSQRQLRQIFKFYNPYYPGCKIVVWRREYLDN